MSQASALPIDERLNNAISALYEVFAAARPPAIEGCPCCIKSRGVDILLTTPLREISGQALWRYVTGVFYTVGSERDFRYLLPRILEISISDPWNANDPEIVLNKLTLANWTAWPVEERQVIETVVDIWFDSALAQDLEDACDGWVGRAAESVLCGAARACIPLTPWLMRLQEPFATPVLLDLKTRFPDHLSAFWEESLAGFRELSAICVQGTG